MFHCCTRRRVTNIGYTNLANHPCKKLLGEYSAALENAVPQSSSHDLNALHEAKTEAFL